MPDITLEHFKRAILDVSANGDNDTLPFDIDNRFLAECQDELAGIAFKFSEELAKASREGAKNLIDELPIFSERLLVPAGTAGFRITTKVHPFWNIYFNALGVAVAEAFEPGRSPRAHSYRFAPSGTSLFNRDASWRAFREASIQDCNGIRAVPAAVIDASDLQKAMLFEVAVAAAEQLVEGRESIDWDVCLMVAARRQREYFDARIPQALSDADRTASLQVAQNLVVMLEEFQGECEGEDLTGQRRTKRAGLSLG
ncbi:hypothetical protein ACVMIH_000808 [Bradyrhizobium sp. USDA 4503]